MPEVTQAREGSKWSMARDGTNASSSRVVPLVGLKLVLYLLPQCRNVLDENHEIMFPPMDIGSLGLLHPVPPKTQGFAGGEYSGAILEDLGDELVHLHT